ncbi:Arylsulfatase [Rubripirellula tenax]|uniref:Arylsulfatase n=1 Tax=Rubripirellula tenax TaxID=2528015 RepID=A0A5C6FBY6_9BACT|nr:sulfatase [Rubripirellula tenax]TWU59253.1 Arylsulfatase [Rubripirellula tenax]
MRNFILTALLACGLSVQAAERPNIVLIFIDDMGYGDVSPFDNEILRTPNIEAMAQRGRTFTEFYASPVCTMSRASLLTGCYHARISMPSVLQPTSEIGLNPDETNLANLLKAKGYATACIGKWHLGHQTEFLPNQQGFDTYFGIPYSNNMTDDYMKGKAPPLPLYENDRIAETEPDQSQFTKRFTERAIRFITDHQDEPFFVYLPHPMIHTPLFASEEFKGKSTMGILGDAIEEIDWSVGQINDTIDRLGLAENTLVIFTSDNGPAHHPAGKLRGVKGSTHEGGVRVPTVMSWPGKIRPGTTCRQITGTIDILPTVANLASADLDPARPIDGSDISSLLFDAHPAPVRETQLYYGWSQTGRLDAIRQGKWKLFLGSGDQPPKRYDNRPTNHRTRPVGEFETALFDLEADPYETTDVREKHPEIAARLKAEAAKRGAEISTNARPVGKLNQAESN